MAGEDQIKKVILELGGKSPLVICEDADVENAAKIAHEACMSNQGQICCAGTRTFVHESIYDDFVARSKELALKRVVGDPFADGTQHGPQIDSEQYKKVLNLIEAGKREGAKLECGGEAVGSKGQTLPERRTHLKTFSITGYFIKPTVFSDVTDDMRIAKEEIFGPVQQIFKYKTLDEAIKRSNDTDYGLAAGIITNDIDKVMTYTQGVRAGTVWVNTFLDASPQVPFGGYKMSGIGREVGVDGLKEYVQIKSVVIKVAGKNS